MSDGMSEGIITDIADAVKGDVPPWFTKALGAGLLLGPKLFVLLASVDTDPAIALPYVARIIALTETLVEDLAAHKPEAEAFAAFDSAAADMIEELRFGGAPP